MKSFLILALIFFLDRNIFAQAPQKIAYQSVVRNTVNDLVTNTTIGVKLSAIQGTISGNVVYAETHTTASNANGLISIEFGSGMVVSGLFSDIAWSNGPWFIQSEVDINGGNDYQLMGAQQLLSVPYAYYATTAYNIAGGMQEMDPVFENSTAATITDADISYWNQKQDSLIAGPGIVIEGNVIRTDLHEVGELFGGGIVISVWIENNVQHGIIASIENLGTVPWSNVVNTTIGSSAQSRMNGISNAAAIMAQEGHVNSAALLCENYAGGGFDDWYLPALWELKLFSSALFYVQTATGESLFDSFFWSSTEFEFPYEPWIITTDAYCLGVGYGDFTNAQKGSSFYVRAFRHF